MKNIKKMHSQVIKTFKEKIIKIKRKEGKKVRDARVFFKPEKKLLWAKENWKFC